MLSFQGEDIDEHIANSKIPGNCPNAVSKSYELCEDGVQVRNLYFILVAGFSNILLGFNLDSQYPLLSTHFFFKLNFIGV